MERKPLGVLFREFVKDEFAKIGLASMDKIIHKKGFGFVTGYMDRLLD